MAFSPEKALLMTIGIGLMMGFASEMYYNGANMAGSGSRTMNEFASTTDQDLETAQSDAAIADT